MFLFKKWFKYTFFIVNVNIFILMIIVIFKNNNSFDVSKFTDKEIYAARNYVKDYEDINSRALEKIINECTSVYFDTCRRSVYSSFGIPYHFGNSEIKGSYIREYHYNKKIAQIPLSIEIK